LSAAALWRAGAPVQRRRAVLLAVLMGHAVLLLLCWQARLQPAAVNEARRALALQLVTPAQPPRPRRAPAGAPHPLGLPANVPPLAPPDFTVAVTTAVGPGAVAAPSGAPSTPGMAAAPARPASGGTPLELRPRAEVLRGALANPAASDPRSNTPWPTVEERIAMGLNPELCVKLERDAQGVVTRRMGRMVGTLTHLQATLGVGAMSVSTCQ
jgi:hypothetical protein